jgi:predicted transcriptional regulator
VDLIPWLQLGGLGIVGLVLWYLIRLVGSGEWIPRQTVDSLLTARDAEIERSNRRGDEWHDAFEAQRHRAELLLDQNRELIEVARTVEHVMESLEDVARKVGRPDAAPPH